LRTAETADGAALWRLVGQVGTLELNSAYAYLLMASDFGATCMVAEAADGSLVGAVIGLRPPREPDCAFVWQVGVLPGWRGRGLALALLQAWQACPAVADARWVTATVAEGNSASRALFRRLAAALRVSCEVRPRFGAELFPCGHPPESEYRLGPFRPPARDP
jgi:L-2,4-diaminobutyric acid acetyltransferase